MPGSMMTRPAVAPQPSAVTYYTAAASAVGSGTVTVPSPISGADQTIPAIALAVGAVVGSQMVVLGVGDANDIAIGFAMAAAEIPAPTSISIPGGPYGIVASADDSKLYITQSEVNTVSIFDIASSTITGTVTVGTGPRPIAITAATTPKLLVGNWYDGTVSIIDAATLTVDATVDCTADLPSGYTNPISICVDPTGATAYVANAGTPGETFGTISVIDIASATVTTTITNAGWGLLYPQWLAYLKTPWPATPTALWATGVEGPNDAIYIGSANTDRIMRLASSDIIVGGPDLGQTTAGAITPDGSLMMVVSPGGSGISGPAPGFYDVLSTIYTEPGYTPILSGIGTILRGASVPGVSQPGINPSGVAFSPDGSVAFITNRGLPSTGDPGTVTAVNTATWGVITVLTVGVWPQGIVSTGSEIYVCNQGSNTLSVVTP